MRIKMPAEREKLKENDNKIALNAVRKIISANLSSPKPISFRCLTYLSDCLSSYCAELTKEAEKELLKENELRCIQGLKEKRRLTEDVFREVVERKNGKNN